MLFTVQKHGSPVPKPSHTSVTGGFNTSSPTPHPRLLEISQDIFLPPSVGCDSLVGHQIGIRKDVAATLSPSAKRLISPCLGMSCALHLGLTLHCLLISNWLTGVRYHPMNNVNSSGAKIIAFIFLF